ncbi:MAG: 1-hydroxy-2-methyl-2-butenyl 4-diphosphate reductase [Deltaproteobacteria bacterium]|nr:1-hydroxy-2-methyl-2-butenyl 4-diphosphate reductase [Deltaproteobacteria bacterium]
MSHKPLVLAPLAVEALAIGRRAGYRVVRTGMGPDKSRRAVRKLAGSGSGAIAVVGLCGALDPVLRPGDVFVADEVRGPDGVVVVCAADEVAALCEAAGLKAVRGALVSTDHIVTGEERTALFAEGARAVDMESAYLAELAAGRRFAVIRVVVDTPSRELSSALHTAVGGARALRVLGRIGAALDHWVN